MAPAACTPGLNRLPEEMILTSPLMLLGLAALPVLAAVYWLRSRSRREVVSSLAFWIDQRNPRRGGRILHRMQTPLTFFLELLAIALLVGAAAGPALLNRDVVRPVMLVLDDSYSMLAHGGKQSFRGRAEQAIVDEMRNNRYVVRVILAGAQPRMIGRPVRDAGQLKEVLAEWTCQSPTADLSAAVSLATEAGDRADANPRAQRSSAQGRPRTRPDRMVGLRREAAEHGLHRRRAKPRRRRRARAARTCQSVRFARSNHAEHPVQRAKRTQHQHRGTERRRSQTDYPEPAARIAAAERFDRRRRPGNRQRGSPAARGREAVAGGGRDCR